MSEIWILLPGFPPLSRKPATRLELFHKMCWLITLDFFCRTLMMRTIRVRLFRLGLRVAFSDPFCCVSVTIPQMSTKYFWWWKPHQTLATFSWRNDSGLTSGRRAPSGTLPRPRTSGRQKKWQRYIFICCTVKKYCSGLVLKRLLASKCFWLTNLEKFW